MPDRDPMLPIPHPGETLRDDFMKPLNLSASRVAKDLGVQAITVSLLIRGKRGISPELALRLARYTRTTPDFWLGLQEGYELRVARRKHAVRVEREVRPCTALAA